MAGKTDVGNHLRCYFCGNKLGPEFSLLSMGEHGVDRVFVAHDKCSQQADKVSITEVIIRTPRKKQNDRG